MFVIASLQYCIPQDYTNPFMPLALRFGYCALLVVAVTTACVWGLIRIERLGQLITGFRLLQSMAVALIVSALALVGVAIWLAMHSYNFKSTCGPFISVSADRLLEVQAQAQAIRALPVLTQIAFPGTVFALVLGFCTLSALLMQRWRISSPSA